MRLITARNGQIQDCVGYDAGGGGGGLEKVRFATGMDAIDALVEGGLARGAVHELLFEGDQGRPMTFAALLGVSARKGRAVAWSDPGRTLYPPALVGMGVPLESLLVLRPRSLAEEVWAVGECLRCPGVAVTVASLARLTRVEARRLQLAAESGGGVGLLLRQKGKGAGEYAAATRWVVSPLSGDLSLQRWRLELVHGQGGRSGKTVILEVCRETNLVRAIDAVADRPVEAETVRRRA